MRRESRRHGVAAVALAIGLTCWTSTPARAEGPADGGAAAPVRETLEGAKLDALIADVSRARKEVKTLRASFTQERRIRLLATTIKSKGELTCATPDRLRWDLAPPDDVVYFVGPEGLSYKTKSSSATVPASGANVARALGDVRALLTGDLGALRERYVLAAARGASDVEITGVAKEKNASVRSFTLIVDNGLVVPISARLLEGKNDSIDLAFSAVVVNGPVDAARLRP